MSLKMKIVLILILYSVFLFGCSKKDERKAVTNRQSEEKAYYARVLDAPLDLYCYIDGNLDITTRMSVCSKLGKHGFDNLTADILFTLNGSRISDIEVEFFSFDSNGVLQKDTSNYKSIIDILMNPSSGEVQGIKNLKDGDVAMRLQLERFCSGHIQFFE